MTLLLSNDEIESLLSMNECIEALERAYRELDNGEALFRQRTDTLVQGPPGIDAYSLKTMDGVLPSQKIASVRINSDLLTWPAGPNGQAMRTKVPRANGRWVGLVLLFSTETGEPLAIIPDGVVQKLRVGATSGIAAKYLAREKAETVGLIGTGWQAGAQIMAATAIRNIKQVLCYSRSRQGRADFADEWTGRCGVPVITVDAAETIAAESDILLCATNSIEPVFRLEWLRPGMHVGFIKTAEAPAGILEACDIGYVHSEASSPLVRAARGLRVRESEGVQRGSIDLQKRPARNQLVDLLSGRGPKRTSPQETTCFLNNSGIGLQFAAVGAVLLRKAREVGLGRELSTEWFTEAVHP